MQPPKERFTLSCRQKKLHWEKCVINHIQYRKKRNISKEIPRRNIRKVGESDWRSAILRKALCGGPLLSFPVLPPSSLPPQPLHKYWLCCHLFLLLPSPFGGRGRFCDGEWLGGWICFSFPMCRTNPEPSRPVALYCSLSLSLCAHCIPRALDPCSKGTSMYLPLPHISICSHSFSVLLISKGSLKSISREDEEVLLELLETGWGWILHFQVSKAGMEELPRGLRSEDEPRRRGVIFPLWLRAQEISVERTWKDKFSAGLKQTLLGVPEYLLPLFRFPGRPGGVEGQILKLMPKPISALEGGSLPKKPLGKR